MVVVVVDLTDLYNWLMIPDDFDHSVMVMVNVMDFLQSIDLKFDLKLKLVQLKLMVMVND